MSVEYKPIAGIGIKVEAEDIYKYFSDKCYEGDLENINELIEELNEKFELFEIVKAGSEYSKLFRYYILIKDIFRYGVFNVDFTLNKFVNELTDYITDEFFILEVAFHKDILVW